MNKKGSEQKRSGGAFEVLTANCQMFQVFCVMMCCQWASSSHCFEELQCLQQGQEDDKNVPGLLTLKNGGTTFLQNTGNYWLSDTVSHPTGPKTSEHSRICHYCLQELTTTVRKLHCSARMTIFGTLNTKKGTNCYTATFCSCRFGK